jgi:hypothetical protein
MTLIVLTVVVVGLLIAALAIYLFMIGVLLNRTASNLGDCLSNVRIVAGQAEVIGPGIKRLNKTGADLLGAMSLLVEGAEGVAATLTPSSAAHAASDPATPPGTATAAASSPVPPATPTGSAARADAAADAPDAVRVGGGMLDSAVGVGYLDV